MKVGDYVRTKSGGIGKIIEIDNNCSCSKIITNNETFGLGWDGKQVNWDFITEIIKSSPNIIDLIESDDYVNGYKVLNVIKFNDNSKMLSLDKIYNNKITNEEIKSIVTKEQFEAIKYEIK